MSLKDRFNERESNKKGSVIHLEEIIKNNKEDIQYVISKGISKNDFVKDVIAEFNSKIDDNKVKFNTNNIFKLLNTCGIKNKWNTKRKTQKEVSNSQKDKNI